MLLDDYEDNDDDDDDANLFANKNYDATIARLLLLRLRESSTFGFISCKDNSCLRRMNLSLF